MKEEDRIAAMLEGRTVFITGGTGFLGKVLIEKILSRCKNVKNIYLLIREKKGKNPEERLKDIFSNMLFDNLRQSDPSAFSRCTPIPGDVSEPNLGLTPHHRALLQSQVEFIFHSAATTRFDDSVRTATRINTRGTKYVLDLARECRNLKVMVHVSTAYSHPEELVLEERAYDPPADADDVIAAIEYDKKDGPDEDVYKNLLGDSPNTYTFSKALAEDLVVQQMKKLPVVIVRPSIVCPTFKDPFPGWCNNLQGPMGIFVGAGKGIIRSMHIQGDYRADFVPADLVINVILVSAWNYLNFDKNQRFYHATGSSKYNKTWEELIETGRKVIIDIPFNGIVWYPGGSLKKSKFVHNLCFFFLQLIPAIFIDLLLVILGYKPVLYQIQRRIQKGNEMLDYFTNRQWELLNTKAIALNKRMTEDELKVYRIDVEKLDLKDYLRKCILGLRRNNLKETDDMLPAARRNLKIMWALDIFCKLFIGFIVLQYLYRGIALVL